MKFHKRLIPCEVCNCPISQGHHLLPKCEHGNFGPIIRLCANCHELFHIQYSVCEAERKNKKTVVSKLIHDLYNLKYFWEICNLVQESFDIQKNLEAEFIISTMEEN